MTIERESWELSRRDCLRLGPRGRIGWSHAGVAAGRGPASYPPSVKAGSFPHPVQRNFLIASVFRTAIVDFL